eukprot:CAMPEP_0177626446 /NCGR_PEP_ID=MMETSP0419_2-20121207/30655_1 /TAXON_ID=582737 /ORGANISM="Tetraselmis sp., Strain GSL018" /LENGTH=182 /DNA_ID=CAMNT_0019127495 /DNA_START=97 /DNA_END=645 /DNA_ORIENTATION=-
MPVRISAEKLVDKELTGTLKWKFGFENVVTGQYLRFGTSVCVTGKASCQDLDNQFRQDKVEDLSKVAGSLSKSDSASNSFEAQPQEGLLSESKTPNVRCVVVDTGDLLCEEEVEDIQRHIAELFSGIEAQQGPGSLGFPRDEALADAEEAMACETDNGRVSLYVRNQLQAARCRERGKEPEL